MTSPHETAAAACIDALDSAFFKALSEPARSYAPVPNWQRLGVAFFVLTAMVGSLVPWLLQASGFTALRVLHQAGVDSPAEHGCCGKLLKQ